MAIVGRGERCRTQGKKLKVPAASAVSSPAPNWYQCLVAPDAAA